MANPIKGQVPLSLSDGRRFTLVFDMEALVEAESAYGKPLEKMMADAKDGFVGAIRAMLFGALRAGHSDVTLRDAAAMFGTDRDAVIKALELAVERSELGGKPGSDASAGGLAGEGRKPANPPGKASGRSGARRG